MSPITRKNWGALLKIVWLQVTLFQLRRQKGILLINDGGKKTGTKEGKIQLYCQPQKLDCLPENSFFVSKQSVSRMSTWVIKTNPCDMFSNQIIDTFGPIFLDNLKSSHLAMYNITHGYKNQHRSTLTHPDIDKIITHWFSYEESSMLDNSSLLAIMSFVCIWMTFFLLP